jgi:hypothetical protein
VKRIGSFLIVAALIIGVVGCAGGGYTPPSQNLEIRSWYDLDAVRNNLAGKHTLMNDLDSTTTGYEELASPTANQGKGWEPIGTRVYLFTGTFDGQGYEIRDLFINRADEGDVGLFGLVGKEGVIKDIGVVNVTAIGKDSVGGLVGYNSWGGTVGNSYSSGSVTGDLAVGGLVGENLFISTVSDSYSSANVNGGRSIGGLVGQNFGTISNSYSSGSVTGDLAVGGLVGANENEEVDAVITSFWDTETSGLEESDGGTGKTTTEMQNIVTFSEAGWNITAVSSSGQHNPSYIWNIVDKLTYPFLSWQSVS